MNKNKFLIHVGKILINEGQIFSITTCPIALALLNAGFINVQVSYLNTTFVYEGVEYLIVQWPKQISDFIHNFDHGDPVKPIQFTLRLQNEK